MCHRPSALLVSTGTPSWGRGVGGTECRCNSSHAPHAPSLSLHRGLPLSEAAVFPRVTSCAHATHKHLSTWHSHVSSHVPHACSPCTSPMFPYVMGHTQFSHAAHSTLHVTRVFFPHMVRVCRDPTVGLPQALACVLCWVVTAFCREEAPGGASTVPTGHTAVCGRGRLFLGFPAGPLWCDPRVRGGGEKTR